MKYYITTAIDYANGNPHVGTAYEKIGADAIARWHRLKGDDVLFLMGMDEHSMNVEKKAVSVGKDPLAYCDEMESKFREVWARLDISFDVFIRTTHDYHVRAATEFWKRSFAKGDIYKAKYTGLYCVSCEAYLKESELKEGKCPNHGTPPQRLEEENWFFRLSKYTDAVREHIEKNPGFVQPEMRRNEVLNVVKDGLEDISISRATFRFGIPVPNDPAHVMYVWFDALINYVSGAGWPQDEAKYAKWWPADLHVVGKDITRFHCAIWPAMLMSAGLPLPKSVWAHGWVHYRGQKQSKSTGNLVDPLDVARQYGADALRYYLLREVAWDRDGDFTWETFTARYNGDLANDLGNLLHRALNMINRFLKGTLAAPGPDEGPDADLKKHVADMTADVASAMDRHELHAALARILLAVKRANTYVEECAPWTLNKQGKTERNATVLGNLASSLAIISACLTPFLPSSAAKLRDQLGLPPKPESLPGGWQPLPAGHRVKEGAVLFPKIEPETET
jgi:methionyl-tRNA synthetase